MAELKYLMTVNYVDKFVFMTEDQKGDNFYSKANALRDDLIFLKILVRRNSISGFGFEITPVCNEGEFRFWYDLFHGSFCGQTDDAYIRKMLADYYMAKNMIDFLNGETIVSDEKWNTDVCKAFKTYFKSMYNLDLEKYAKYLVDGNYAEITDLVREL